MIQVFKPFLREKEIMAALQPIFESGWIGLGPKTREFEEALSRFIGSDTRFLALNSCTAGLHLAMRALKLKPGSKVATTPNTFVSTNHAILYENLVPVFCDVEARTGNISANALEAAVKRHNIAAILVVHLGGYACDMDTINAIARCRNIPVIEDCAHAFGGKYRNGKRIGDTPNLCAWSFHAVKNLPMGDGGAVSTINPEIAERLKTLRWLGIDQDTISRSSGGSGYKWEYQVNELGYKYHLNDILASIGLVQLRHLEADNRRRRHIAQRYQTRLGGSPFIQLPEYADMNLSAFHFYPVFFFNREAVYKALTRADIFPSMHYRRNDTYPLYRHFDKVGINGEPDLIETPLYESRELTLPLHLGLSDQDVNRIGDVVLQAAE